MRKDQIENLESLGVNLSETLERFVENEDLYFKCLKKFKDDRNLNLMLDAITGGDVNQAFEAAHALKGVSANLGLEYLYYEMNTITEVFRAGNLDFDPINLQNVKMNYEKVISIIDKL